MKRDQAEAKAWYKKGINFMNPHIQSTFEDYFEDTSKHL